MDDRDRPITPPGADREVERDLFKYSPRKNPYTEEDVPFTVVEFKDGTLEIPTDMILRLLELMDKATNEQIYGLIACPPKIWLAFSDNLLCTTLVAKVANLTIDRHPRNHVHIHPRPVAFLKGGHKADWVNAMPGHNYEVLDCLSSFLKLRRYRANGSKIHTHIAFMKTPTTDNVRDQDWHVRPWHQWCIALSSAAEGYGKTLLILEPDSHVDIDNSHNYPPSQAFWGGQRAVFETIKKKCKINAVYMGNLRLQGSIRSTRLQRGIGRWVEGRCIVNAINWLNRMSMIDDAPFNPEDRHRWLSFKRLDKISDAYL